MEIINATRLIVPAPDSRYRLVPCECGNDQPVYVIGEDGLFRVRCLECNKETGGFAAQHEAQVCWNKECHHD